MLVKVSIGHPVRVFETDIDAAAVAGWPDAVGEVADGGRRHLFEGVGAKHLHFVRSADCDVSKLAIAIVCKIHVVGNRSRMQRQLLFKRRLRAEHLHFAHVLQGKPHFIIFRTHSDVGTEGTGLWQAFQNFL